MVKNISFFILLILQNFCFSMARQSYEISELDFTSNQLIVDFAKKMQKKELHACGLGGREDKGKVMDFKVTFQYGKVLDISTARELVVETILLLVEEINNNEAMRKYLYHYPFTPDDVIVAILPDCSKLSNKEDSDFVRVSAHLGQISYYGRENPYVDLLEETFSEARQILNYCLPDI
jgi:hypothetical protein